MAFLQTDMPPSTAPASSRRMKAIAIASPLQQPSSRFLGRLILWTLAVALLVVPGYFAAAATESLAVGILAGDLAFLVAVAGWTAVAGDGSRR